MKIVAISDTHNFTPDLPEGDVLIHAGDATMMGTENEVRQFGDWIEKIKSKFRFIIFTPGNHDFYFENKKLENVFINRRVIVDGVKFWLSPYSPIFGHWAFMKSDEELSEMWKEIPEDTDILVTHVPPKNILDLTIGNIHVGSLSLLERVFEIKPKIHIFGHIHEGYGTHYNKGIKFINASVINEYYKNVNEPIVINL